MLVGVKNVIEGFLKLIHCFLEQLGRFTDRPQSSTSDERTWGAHGRYFISETFNCIDFDVDVSLMCERFQNYFLLKQLVTFKDRPLP